MALSPSTIVVQSGLQLIIETLYTDDSDEPNADVRIWWSDNGAHFTVRRRGDVMFVEANPRARSPTQYFSALTFDRVEVHSGSSLTVRDPQFASSDLVACVQKGARFSIEVSEDDEFSEQEEVDEEMTDNFAT